MAFPTYDEFREFLEKNKKQKFEQGTYYACAMAVCANGPVSEGYSSDVDINAPGWFREFERRTSFNPEGGRDGIWSGAELLDVLNQIDPKQPADGN